MPAILERNVHTGQSAALLAGGRRGPAHDVFLLWCEFTGTEPASFDLADVEAFIGRPEVPLLARVPAEVLREAAEVVRRPHSLPLERWLIAVRAGPDGTRGSQPVGRSRPVGSSNSASTGKWSLARRTAASSTTR